MGLDVPFNIILSVLILHIVNVRRKSGRVAEFLVAEAMLVIGKTQFNITLSTADVLLCFRWVAGSYLRFVDNASLSAISVIWEWAGVPAVAPLGCANLSIFSANGLVMGGYD